MALLTGLLLTMGGCNDDDSPGSSLDFVSEVEIQDVNGQAIDAAGRGSDVDVVLSIRNRSDAETTLEFDSTRRSDFLVLNAAGEVVRIWSSQRSFSPTVTTEDFDAGERKTFEMEWSDLSGDNGDPLPAGEYEVQAWAATEEEDGIDNLSPGPLRSTLKTFEITD